MGTQLKIALIALALLAAFIVLTKGKKTASVDFQRQLDAAMPADPENFDLGLTLIKLSKLIDPEADEAAAAQDLDNLTAELRQKLGNEANPEMIVAAFNNYIFGTHNFSYDVKASKYYGGDPTVKMAAWEKVAINSIPQVLRYRSGICLSLALVYLSLADRLDMPFYGVLLPTHIYIKYKEPGKSGINVEATNFGGEYYGYGDMGNIDLLNSEKTVYGKLLTKHQLLAPMLNNMASVMMSSGRNREAMILLRESLRIMPNTPTAMLNMGILLYSSGKKKESEKLLYEAMELNPYDIAPVLTAGCLLAQEKREKEARFFLERAMKYEAYKKHAQECLSLLEKGAK